MMLVDLNLSRIENIAKNALIGENGVVFIIDPNNHIIFQTYYHPMLKSLNAQIIKILANNKSGRTSLMVNGRKMLVDFTTSDYTEWKIASLASEGELHKTTRIIIGVTAFLIMLVIGCSWHLICRAVNGLTSMLNQVKMKMGEARNGDMGVSMQLDGPVEIEELGRNFNQLLTRINFLMQKNQDEQRMIRMSELKGLQAQINPHFLYNTLDSIVWLAEDNRLQEVITMTLALARYFRIGISKGNDIINISEEIEHVRNYLIIQSYRYANRFSYMIDVDQGILKYKTPKLILQPLVENAIYHGIKNKETVGMIRITGSIIQDKVLFEIVDNGIGMTPEQLRILETSLKQKSDSSPDKKSFGMKNVHERLQLLFGEEFGLKISSTFNQETRVQLWLPLLKEEKGNV